MIGAGVLWIGGDIAGLPFLAVLFLRWMRDDERTARSVDAELDRAEVDRTEVDRTELDRAEVDRAAVEAPAPTHGLWWEADETLAARFGRPPKPPRE